MILLRTHSRLPIRSTGAGGPSILSVPLGLSISIDVTHEFGHDNIISSISPGQYIANLSGEHGFCKFRGEVAISGILYHIEIISTQSYDRYYPLIVRLWDVMTCKGYEYLCSFNIIMLRQHRFNLRMTEDTVITQILTYFAEVVYGENFGEWHNLFNTVYSESTLLIPSFSAAEYNSRFNAIRNTPQLEETLNASIEAMYAPHLNAPNIQILMNTIEGKVPHAIVDNYLHIGRFLNSENICVNMDIQDIEQYDGIVTLAKIPFDYFTIQIDLTGDSCCIEIEELDNMAGTYLPFTFSQSYNYIQHVCQEFLYKYFESEFSNKGVHYCVRNGKSKYGVDKVVLHRTMDEYIVLSIYTCGYCYDKTFDLLTLAIMSPTISD